MADDEYTEGQMRDAVEIVLGDPHQTVEVLAIMLAQVLDERK